MQKTADGSFDVPSYTVYDLPDPTTLGSPTMVGTCDVAPNTCVVGIFAENPGTTGFNYTTMTISDDVVEQAEQCLRNIQAALTAAGCTFADVVRVRYLLPDRADFEPCWPVLRRYLGEVRPAATMMVCGLSDPRMRIEIEADARRPGG